METQKAHDDERIYNFILVFVGDNGWTAAPERHCRSHWPYKSPA